VREREREKEKKEKNKREKRGGMIIYDGRMII
jgi:hypothetical protein